MKITVLLRYDHEAVKSLFNNYKKSEIRNQNRKRELFEVIRRELMIHSEMEREIFYPALRAVVSKKAGEFVSSALVEHRTMEESLHEIAGMNPQDRKFDARVIQFIDEVRNHIDREEEEIFDEARKSLPEYRLEELGLEMEDRKKILGELAA